MLHVHGMLFLHAFVYIRALHDACVVEQTETTRCVCSRTDRSHTLVRWIFHSTRCTRGKRLCCTSRKLGHLRVIYMCVCVCMIWVDHVDCAAHTILYRHSTRAMVCASVQRLYEETHTSLSTSRDVTTACTSDDGGVVGVVGAAAGAVLGDQGCWRMVYIHPIIDDHQLAPDDDVSSVLTLLEGLSDA